MRVARMIIVDAALEAREAAGNPVRVVMIGAGFVAGGVANQIANALPGMRLCEAPEGRPCDRVRREQDRQFLGQRATRASVA